MSRTNDTRRNYAVNTGEIEAFQRIIDRSRRIVFFGGAGVSTASGIPDYRSADGLYAEEEDGLTPEMILSRTFFYLQPERFFDYYRKHLLHPEAKPNAAHRKLFELEQADKLRGIVTQNIDGLHKAAGNIRVYELHGNVHENHCMDCNASYPMETVLQAEGIPRCKDCGGVIKPDVVLYGEPLEKYVCIGAIREITNADTLIVAGTSLAVEPAASFISNFRGKNLVVINRDPIPAEEQATLVIHGDVAEVMEQIRCL
ncbi:MAG: NAD-dependent protein deacylase [Clostridia bacterium]|nr:NAD-dependent protein deacylase [Clostridia bacterium]